MLPPFSLLRPTTLAELIGVLGEEQVPYCGGTELLLAMRAGLQRPATLVDLKRVEELAGVHAESGELVVGATTTHMEAAGHQLVRDHLPMFAEVETAVGNARVRAQGSIGGNLCFAEPKSDVATALIVFEATVSLASADGERRSVPVEEFIVGPYEADKAPEELLVDVRVPIRDGRRAVYRKYQTRERPTVGVAVAVEEGRCRLAVGAVGERPVVWTFDRTESIDPADIAAEIDPVPELTGSERYLRHMTEVYVRRAVEDISRMGQE